MPTALSRVLSSHAGALRERVVRFFGYNQIHRLSACLAAVSAMVMGPARCRSPHHQPETSMLEVPPKARHRALRVELRVRASKSPLSLRRPRPCLVSLLPPLLVSCSGASTWPRDPVAWPVLAFIVLVVGGGTWTCVDPDNVLVRWLLGIGTPPAPVVVAPVTVPTLEPTAPTPPDDPLDAEIRRLEADIDQLLHEILEGT